MKIASQQGVNETGNVLGAHLQGVCYAAPGSFRCNSRSRRNPRRSKTAQLHKGNGVSHTVKNTSLYDIT